MGIESHNLQWLSDPKARILQVQSSIQRVPLITIACLYPLNVDWACLKCIAADALSLAAGYWHTCALLVDGSVWCWGQNNYGQLGYGYPWWWPNSNYPGRIFSSWDGEYAAVCALPAICMLNS